MMVDIEVEARAAGVTAFCAKPMFMSDIRNTLMSAIGQKLAEDTILPSVDSGFQGQMYICEYCKSLMNNSWLILRKWWSKQKVRNSTPGNYDLVLMDVQMPVMNGYEATKQIRALDDPALAGITILAMTANAFDEDRKKALKCGMDGFLSKPIVIEELIAEKPGSGSGSIRTNKGK